MFKTSDRLLQWWKYQTVAYFVENGPGRTVLTTTSVVIKDFLDILPLEEVSM
jgi:hypothetical protein